PDLERSAAGPEPGSAEYVAALANRVVAHHARPILILDEYEHIVERDIHDRLELLTRVCADRLTLVVAARNRPALPVERLEPAGRLARVSWTELRFDADEARDLLTTGYGLPTALAPTAIDTETIVRELRDREEILDALLRFALGFDLKDRELFRTAFTPDAEFDFRPVAAELGLEVPVMVGVAAIEAVHFNPDVRLDTTHAVSNARIGFIGDRARLTALVEAQHLPTGDHTRHLLLKNRYAVDLVRTGAGWAMSRLYVENVWRTGDPKVLIGA
ncbi:nuclear transport factor 2 family protein, partial [Streptomyces microflavus]